MFDELLVEEFGRIDPKILASGIVAYRRARESALVLYPHVQMTLLELAKRGISSAWCRTRRSSRSGCGCARSRSSTCSTAVVTFDDTNERKPSPGPFREILKRLQVEPNEALMVGDWAERDVVGGKSLGMKTVFARYGDTFGTETSGADYDVDDVIELVGIVDRLNGVAPGQSDGARATPAEASGVPAAGCRAAVRRVVRHPESGGRQWRRARSRPRRSKSTRHPRAPEGSDQHFHVYVFDVFNQAFLPGSRSTPSRKRCRSCGTSRSGSTSSRRPIPSCSTCPSSRPTRI